MDLAAVERTLRASGSGAVVIDPRLLRRVIKRHRGLPGLGLQVPHARCYVIEKQALLSIIEPTSIGAPAESLPDDVILVARPAPDELLGKASYEVLAGLWRTAFHARIHLELARRAAAGKLEDAAVRERIDAIGQIEFDEIRAVLRHDDLLLPPGGDREAYTEFAALYLELRHFAPRLIRRVFPSLTSFGRVDETVAADVDGAALLELCRPEGAAPLEDVARTARDTSTPTYSAPAALPTLRFFAPKAPSNQEIARLIAAADAARKRGNNVRAALLRLTAATGAISGEREAIAIRAAARKDLEQLNDRLGAALRPPNGEASGADLEWTSLLLMVAEEATLRRGLRYPIEARLLYDLQAACVESERAERAVDLVTWVLSFGGRPIVRPLPLTRQVRVARAMRLAEEKLRHVRVATADRRLLAKLLRLARERADDNVRRALRPKILEVLSGVGLRPVNTPERVALRKLVEELLDQAVLRGHMSIGGLRDAVSRNQMKLDDLSSVRELLDGDALIEADRRLSVELDGVYRRGEVYLRSLQRISSIAFGTLTGRRFVLYLALPFGAAFVLLEGVSHMVNPLLGLAKVGPVPLVSMPIFLATAAAIFALIHSEGARVVSRRALAVVGATLRGVFLTFPRWLLSRPVVKAVLLSRPARIVARFIIAPLVAAAVLYAVTPIHELSQGARFGGLGGLFLAANLLINSRLGVLLEEVAIDWIARQWGLVSRRLLPGLFRFIVDAFRGVLELLERAIYKVDEWLRFREGEPRALLVIKAVLGLVWFFAAYIIRLYVCLLIEPEVNPIKHFPVVTVAHKIILPVSPAILSAFQSVLSPLGPVVSGAIAGTTVFLLPSVFGFLVWELKENWRLYRASRPKALRAALVGAHGETMHALMAPGFHSGTLPKLFAKIRRAARRADEELGGRVVAPDSGLSAGPDEGKVEASLGSYREALHEVEIAIRRLFERELCDLLRESPVFPNDDIAVRSVTLGSNRVRVELACPSLSGKSCEISFEEQSGMIVAGVSRAGFLEVLSGDLRAGACRGDDDGRGDAKRGIAQGDGKKRLPSGQRLVFENALAGLYKLAAVDLVREQIEASLRGKPPYDISDEGLVVWPEDADNGAKYRTEVIYDLNKALVGPTLWPKIRGDVPASPPGPLDARRVIFREERVLWTHWVDVWSPDRARAGRVPRLLGQGRGGGETDTPSILPERVNR